MATRPSSSNSKSPWAALPRWVRLLFIVAGVELVVCAGLMVWMKSAGIL